MEYRSFGNTTLRVSVVGFGAWAIGGPAMAGTLPIGWGATDDAESMSALRTAFDCGVNFFDTADFYGLGHSEQLIGTVFGNNDKIVVATKAGFRLNDDGSIAHDYTLKHIVSACEQSLRRLRRDTIDLYQLHSARIAHLDQGDCITAMERLQQEGKIRYWGLSLNTFAPEPEAEFMMQHRLGHGFQLVLNIINQRSVPLLRRMQEAGYGVIARMPYQFGLLTGAFDQNRTFASNDHRSFRLSPPILKAALDALEEVRPAAERLGLTLSQLALSYCASYAEVSTIIPGIRTPKQATESAVPLMMLELSDMELIRALYVERFEPIVELMRQAG